MLFKPKWVKLLWRNLRPDIKRINELEKLRVASNIAHETLAVCILGSPVTTRRAVKVSLEHFSAHNPKATEKELFRMVYVSKLQALDLEVPEKEIDRSVESIESLDALRDSIVELEKLYLSFPVPLHIKKQIDKILAQEESDKKAPAENIIKSLEQTYFDLKKDNPDRDEHWLLANTWLNSYGSTKQAKQKGIEWAKFVAYKDTLQFSILEPPKSIRALALFLVYTGFLRGWSFSKNTLKRLKRHGVIVRAQGR